MGIARRASNQILSEKTHAGKRCETTLSCLAYFDAQHEATHTPSRLLDKYTGQIDNRNVSSSQNRRIPHQKPVQVSIHADMIKIRIPKIARGAMDRKMSGSTGGIRGNITGFSRASRKRMIETMASIRNPGGMLFLTMTFDDSVLLDLNDNLEAMFEAFRRRFERQFPKWSALWRKEWQDRKSGDFIGTFVPHYHFIIMTGVHYEKAELQTIADTFAAWGKSAWHEITSSSDENHLIYGFDVSAIKSRKHAYYYVSKYVAKQDSNGEFSGRHWGRIGKFNCSVSETFTLEIEEYIVFRRLVKKWLKTRVSPLPETATDKQIKSHAQKLKKCRKYSNIFAKGTPCSGCTVFGLGDTNPDGSAKDIFAGYWQFIAESRRQVMERKALNRGYGD